MSFETFSKAISRWFGPALPPFDLEALSRLNPRHFYEENFRSVMNLSSSAARSVLEIGVDQGVFIRGIEVICPDGSVGAQAEREEDLPPTVPCYDEDGNGLMSQRDIAVDELQRQAFYRVAP